MATTTTTTAVAKAAAGPIRHAAMEILNCGLKVSKEEISHALQSLGISSFVKITKAQNEAKCKVMFPSDEEKNRAMGIIASTPATTDQGEGPWKVKSVYVRRIYVKQEVREQFQQKRAADAVAPWREMPYPEQLQKKQAQLKEAMDKWTSSLNLTDFEFKHIVPSPAVREYRNKLDFTVGLDADGKPCAGFRVGAYKQGGTSSFRVEVTEECEFTSPRVGLQVASHLTKLMQTSPLPVYDQEAHSGYWRALSIRWSEKTKELMVLIRCNPQGEQGEQEMQRCIKDFQDNFQIDNGIRVTSMYWQWWEGISFQAAPESGYIHAFGKEYIEEEVLGMRFKVSVGAFFQVNTNGCETLFSIVRDIVQKKDDSGSKAGKTMLLDICCGTGVIGLLCAGSAHSVFGVELSAPAIDDARKNAIENKLEHKAKFVCSKAETVLSRLLSGVPKLTLSKSDTVLTELDEQELEASLKEAKSCDEIVAIVDPPRAGLHKSVVKALLRCSAVSRIIYVSCNPTGSFVDNAKELCGTGPVISNNRDVRVTEGILPFRPVQFIPVDLFPHTEHCELIAEFVRPKKNAEPMSPNSHNADIVEGKRPKLTEGTTE